MARSRDENVERALYESAVGGTRPVQKKYKLRRIEYDETSGRKKCEYEEMVDGVEEVYIPPSSTAMQFWLRCRMPEKWGNAGGKAVPGQIELPEIEATSTDAANEVEL